VLDRATIDRLREFDSGGAPVVSVYLDVPKDLGDLRSVAARLKAALRPVRELAESAVLEDDAVRSIRADVDSAISAADRAAAHRGGSMALFLCNAAGLKEIVGLPGPVRDRAVADRGPYLGPMEAMLSHYRRYCAVVADRRTASIYRFSMGGMEAWEEIGEEEVRKENYGGFSGYEERGVRARAETVARRLYQAAAERIAALMREGEFDLLMIGGNQANVDGIVDELAADVVPHLAGTFTIDPGTASPSDVLARCSEVAREHESRTSAEAVTALLDTVGSGDRAVLGIDRVLQSANQRAIARLIVAATGIEPGVACVECGWLGRRGALCGYCGEATLPVPDLIDRIAERVRADGGEVLYVLGASAMGDVQAGAMLRYPVTAVR
jgi:peptide chain release factor subunit 1